MSFQDAKTSFQMAIETVAGDSDPATWNMLSGLIKLSESLQHLDSDVRSLHHKIDQTSRDVKLVKNR
jgi:hypothetical protein